jgi:zinc protease
MIKFKKEILDNGLRVIVHTDTSTPFVAVNVCYNVGAKHEYPERTGFAHLFEHLTFGGSLHVPDYDTPSQQAGGANNAFTSNDITNYYITVPAANVETALWLESDRMLGPKFSAKGIDIQRNVVIEEFRQRNLNRPYGDLWHLLRALAYKVHPYRWPAIGLSVEHIEKAKLMEVKDFFYHHYAPNNAVLVISGNIDSDNAFRLASKWFRAIPERKINNSEILHEPDQIEDRSETVYRDVPIDTFYIAWHMAGRNDKDFYAADLLTDILAGGNSSRIEEKLIKGKKLFTEADVFLSGENDPGLLIATGKVNENVDFSFAQNVLVDELILTTAEKISDYELEKVKNKVEADLLFNEIGYLEKAIQLASFEILDNADLINEQAEKYRNVTAEDILRVAKGILRKGNRNTLNYFSIKKKKQ